MQKNYSLWLLVLLSLPALGKAKVNRLNELVKITVGPSDNFGGVVDGSGKKLFYTKYSNLRSNIYVQDLNSGQESPFMGTDVDSRDPDLHESDGIVFTYFGDDAAGDVCIRQLDKTINKPKP